MIVRLIKEDVRPPLVYVEFKEENGIKDIGNDIKIYQNLLVRGNGLW